MPFPPTWRPMPVEYGYTYTPMSRTEVVWMSSFMILRTDWGVSIRRLMSSHRSCAGFGNGVSDRSPDARVTMITVRSWLPMRLSEVRLFPVANDRFWIWDQSWMVPGNGGAVDCGLPSWSVAF